jgi:hypothetical protein
VSVSEKSINMSMALLLVATVLSPFAVAPAAADTFNKTVQSSESVQIDTSGVSQAKIEISGTYTTSSGSEVTHKLIRKTVTGDSKYYLVDRQAYDSYSVTVTTESSTASVTISGESYRIGGPGYTRLGHTGGDTDLTCGAAEKANSILGGYYTDCNPVPSDSVDINNLSATEVHNDLYAAAKTDSVRIDNYNTTLNNYLEDVENVALLEGKNAYIKALNNGSSKTAAKTAAIEASEDYYTTKQLNLINEWNATIYQLDYITDRAQSKSSLSASDVMDTEDRNDYGLTYVKRYTSGSPGKSLTLVNGSTKKHQKAYIKRTDTGRMVYDFTSTDSTSDTQLRVTVKPPSGSSLNNFQYSNLIKDYGNKFYSIQDQANATADQLSVFVDNTYTEYQTGEINNTDLIDPYLAQREYGPGGNNFSTWAATTLTLLGANSPETLEKTGNFTVSDATENGTSYSGILLSQENPASGGFSAGTTYDATQLNGSQFVVTDQEVHELTGNFTVDSIKTKDGTSVNNVTYRDVTYTTSNTTEYAELLEQLKTTQAELDALQTEALAGTGTDGGSGTPDYVADLLNAVGAPVNPLTRAGAVGGVGVGGLALIARVIGG